MAHDHIFPPIHLNGTFIYQRFECLRCKFDPHFVCFSLFIYIHSQFANVHDVSWGTKGDNTVAKGLGTVATGKTSQVEAEVPTDEKDIDTLYQDAIHVLNTKPPKMESKVDAGTKQEDYYRTFRTK